MPAPNTTQPRTNMGRLGDSLRTSFPEAMRIAAADQSSTSFPYEATDIGRNGSGREQADRERADDPGQCRPMSAAIGTARTTGR